MIHLTLTHFSFLSAHSATALWSEESIMIHVDYL